MIYRIRYNMLYKGHVVMETYTYTDDKRLNNNLRRINSDTDRELVGVDAASVDWD